MKKVINLLTALALSLVIGMQSAVASSLSDQDLSFAFGAKGGAMEVLALSDQEMARTEGEWWPVFAFIGRMAYSGYRAFQSYRATRGVEPIGGVIRGYTRHGLNQSIGRNGVGVSPRAILDTVRNPRSISSSGRGWNRTNRYNGNSATVVTNFRGQIVTSWPRNRGGRRY